MLESRSRACLQNTNTWLSLQPGRRAPGEFSGLFSWLTWDMPALSQSVLTSLLDAYCSWQSLSLPCRPWRRRSRTLDRRHRSCSLSPIHLGALPCTWWDIAASWEFIHFEPKDSLYVFKYLFKQHFNALHCPYSCTCFLWRK